MKGNWQYALLAFALAVVAWYFVSGREKVETWVEMNIQLSGNPENLLVTGGLPSTLKVRIRGPKGLMQRLDKSGLAYSLNLSTLVPGENLIPVQREAIALSSSFEVMELEPTRFKIMAELLETRLVRVKPVVEGELDPDWMLLSEVAEPAMVEVSGPTSALEEITEARTRTITLDTDRPGVVGEEVPLDVPDAVEVSPQEVFVRLEYGERTQEWSPTVAIEVDNMTGLDISGVWPQKVRLHLTVPVSLPRDEQAALEEIRAWVAAEPGLPPGEHQVEVQVSLPEGCTRMSVEPEYITITLDPPPAPPVPEPTARPEEVQGPVAP